MKLSSRSKPARKPARSRTPRVAAARRGPNASSNALILQAECTLAESSSLKSALCALLPNTATVTLDAAAVERIDTATLQMLAAFVRDRRLAGGAIEWRSASTALRDAARLLGMDSMLLLTEAAS